MHRPAALILAVTPLSVANVAFSCFGSAGNGPCMKSEFGANGSSRSPGGSRLNAAKRRMSDGHKSAASFDRSTSEQADVTGVAPRTDERQTHGALDSATVLVSMRTIRVGAQGDKGPE